MFYIKLFLSFFLFYFCSPSIDLNVAIYFRSRPKYSSIKTLFESNGGSKMDDDWTGVLGPSAFKVDR